MRRCNPSKNIVENAVNSKDHTTLVAAVKAAGLVSTLEGTGPFTALLPQIRPSKNCLPGPLTPCLNPKITKTHRRTDLPRGRRQARHESAGEKIKAGGGKAELKTVNGGSLWVMANGPHNIQLKDARGNVANITTYDVNQSNGVIDVIDTVLMP